MILTGIALIPWQLGDLIKQLVKTANQIQTLCPTCNLSFHDADAQFCKLCGTKLKRFKRVRLPIREMGRILSPALCSLCSPPPLPLLPTRALDAALRYIAEFAAVLESVWFVPGIEPTPRSAALEFAGLGKIHGSSAASCPLTALHSGFELLPAVV